MRTRTRRLGLAVVAPIATLAMAAAAVPLDFNMAPESKLWVEGGSTVRGYKCEATVLDAAIAASPVQPGQMIQSLGSSVQTVDLKIPVAKLDCGNGKMNDHMRKALKADKNPTIAFKLKSYKVEAQPDGSGLVKMDGSLTISGTQKPVTLEAKATETADGSLQVTGSKALKMTEFGVEPPKLMLGTLKVHDDVTVHYQLVLK